MASSSEHKNILVYGGNGAVGSGCVNQFKDNGWKVISITLWKNMGSQIDVVHEDNMCEKSCHVINDKDSKCYNINKNADVNILVHGETNLYQQEVDILESLGKELKGEKLDAVICVAGGFDEGSLDDNLPEKLEKMWNQNVWPSVLTAKIAKQFLKAGGFICFSGASAAIDGTPKAIGYGMAKAAVHQLTKSLASPDSGLPAKSLCVAILPVTLDTLMNRQIMPESDISAWTPTKYIVDLLYRWAIGKDRPKNGCLVQFLTQNFNTDIIFL